MRYFAFLAALLWITFPSLSPAQSERPGPRVLTLAADHWCPYNCEPGSDFPGYMIEIAREVFEPAGYEIRYEVINWARALAMTREGRHDGVVGAFHGDAPDFVFPDEPLGRSGNGFFVLAENDWLYKGPESLTGLRVGVIRGYDYGALNIPLRDFAQTQIGSGNDALERNINKLLLGRLDALVEDVSVITYRLSRMNARDRLQLASASITYDDAFIAFSPAIDDGPYLAAILGTGVRRLRHINRLGTILERYGLEDWR